MKNTLLKILVLCLSVCCMLCVLTACDETNTLPNGGGTNQEQNIDDNGGGDDNSTSDHKHVYKETVINPTCTEQGYTLHKCSCGDEYKDNYTNALKHEFTNYIYDNNATYESDGTKTAVCNRGCGATNTITAKNTKLIAVESLTLNNNELYMVAGETDNLSTTILPNNATNQEIIWSSNHNQIATVENGNITAIGKGTATITAKSANDIVATCQVYVCSNSFTYKVNEGKASITGFKDDLATLVVIPYNYNSFPITDIEIGVFRNKTMIKKVVIRDNINAITDSLFFGCNSLEEIILPNTLESIGKSAFSGCSCLRKIDIPNQVKKIGERAFSNCKSLTTITIPSNVEQVNKCIFFGCLNLTGESIIFEKTYGWYFYYPQNGVHHAIRDSVNESIFGSAGLMYWLSDDRGWSAMINIGE